jgi:circadian clock protein KaiC
MKKRSGLSYVPTGVAGFDEITGGGLPAGRITVVVGGPGSGKTIFAAQTLAEGARRFGEPGIFVAFEEPPREVLENIAGFSWRFDRRDKRKVSVLDARLAESVVHSGEFDLLGLLAVLGAQAKATRAKRIVLDGLDVLLAPLDDPKIARREVFRLREWLQESGMTAIITAKADVLEARSAREYDFLQFMADCVVTMHHRVAHGMALRFLRVSKCRGGAHSANEFPFSLGERGIEVATGSSDQLRHRVSSRRLSSGVERLDAMLGGGYYQCSSTLITGVPGTAKTTLAAAFVEAAARRNERTLFVSFDEAPEQIERNVASVGIRLGRHVKTGVLLMHSVRSRVASPEAHVARIRSLLQGHRARNLVIDPISALARGEAALAESAALELLDLAKSEGITSLSTSLLGSHSALSEETPIGISTIADTWMHLTYVSRGGERNRALTIIKSRGTSHSNQVRELVLSPEGVTLSDVYSEGGEVLMGTMRWQREHEQRESRQVAVRDASLREREAVLALAENKARVQLALSEQAMREATVERLKLEREFAGQRSASVTRELRQRRGADAPSPERPPRIRSRAR